MNLDKVILFLIYIAPTVHLSFGKRFGDLSNVLAVLTIIYLYKYKPKLELTDNRLFYFITLLFFVYPLEIFISQLMRWNWHVHDYMDQIRFIFMFPVFIYLVNKQISPIKFIEKSIPIALIISFFTTKYLYPDNQFGDRFTNNFTDPLAYGQISLAMSTLLMTTFFLSKNNTILFNIYKILGIIFGIVISIKTQSRTGWFALPIVLLLLIYLNRKKLGLKIIISFIPLIILSVLASYLYINIIHIRVSEAINEIINYPWSGGVAPDTSVGLRITFNRIGLFYIKHSPWYGMGNKGFTSLMSSPELTKFADKSAIEICYEKLFHNELMTQTVRYGLLGFIGYILVLITPFFILFKKSSSKNNLVKTSSILGMMFLLTQIIAGFSDEVLNLKYMILYFMLIMSIIYSAILESKKIK